MKLEAFKCDRKGETKIGQKPRRIALLDREYCNECADRFDAFLLGLDDLRDIVAVRAFLAEHRNGKEVSHVNVPDTR